MNKAVNEKNVELWSGFSELYNDSRPKPPKIINTTILSWLNRNPEIVVDVGCGTGLSTIIWEDTVKKIVGIEPNDDMRATAEKNLNSDRITFLKGVSNETGIPSGYVDILTVSQAFHWMDIDSTLNEFHRILKPDGVLAIYDFILPPVMGWEIEEAFLDLRMKCSEIVYSQEVPPVHNGKSSYNDIIKAFGKFIYSRETMFHGFERWPLQKVIGFVVNISNADFAMKMDPSIKTDVDIFLNLVKAHCADEMELVFPYKMVMAVK